MVSLKTSNFKIKYSFDLQASSREHGSLALTSRGCAPRRSTVATMCHVATVPDYQFLKEGDRKAARGTSMGLTPLRHGTVTRTTLVWSKLIFMNPYSFLTLNPPSQQLSPPPKKNQLQLRGESLIIFGRKMSPWWPFLKGSLFSKHLPRAAITYKLIQVNSQALGNYADRERTELRYT